MKNLNKPMIDRLEINKPGKKLYKKRGVLKLPFVVIPERTTFDMKIYMDRGGTN
jgi:hypothetical protein